MNQVPKQKDKDHERSAARGHIVTSDVYSNIGRNSQADRN